MDTSNTLTLRVDWLIWGTLVLVASVASLVVLATAFLPDAVDWEHTYQPAAQALVQAESPYDAQAGFYNPPWTLLPLAPFIAAQETGRGAVFIVAYVVYALIAVHYEASPIALALFLTSPPILHSQLNGNLEWLVLLGLLLPPRWGLLLVVIKPQVGVGIAVWWIVKTWREDGIRAVGVLLTPLVGALALSVALYGVWPTRAEDLLGEWWNASLWRFGPLAQVISIGGGIGLLGWSIKTRNDRPALAAAPWLSPHVLLHSWAGVLLALVNKTWALALAWVILWTLAVMAA